MNTQKNFLTKLLFVIGLIGCSTEGSDSDLSIIGGTIAPNTENVKGSYPATVGFLVKGIDQKCTATRIDRNLFLTAAHCLNNVKNQTTIFIKPSNAQNFEVLITSIRLSPGYTNISKSEPDLATFSVEFGLAEERFLFDALVDVAKINYDRPQVDQAVSLAGFGCIKSRDFSPLLIQNCVQGTDFLYMKTAKSKISAIDSGLILPGSDYFFRLPMPLTFSEKVDGYIGSGDSGGPVYNLQGEIIGVNSSTLGVSIDSISAGTTFHNWLGQTKNRDFIEGGRTIQSPLFYSVSKKFYLFKNGDNYIGSVRDGYPNGEGTMHYADGKTYVGSWANGVRSGQGRQTWNAGAVMTTFSGNWENDRPQGEGIMEFSSGQRYEGDFVSGKMHGHGKMFYKDGTIREGKFVDNKREGTFALTRADGSTGTQVFAKDVLVENAG